MTKTMRKRMQDNDVDNDSMMERMERIERIERMERMLIMTIIRKALVMKILTI